MTAVAQTPVDEIKSSSPKPPDVSSLQVKRIERMKEYFQNRPKEEIRIRKELGEQWVQINGYAFRIQAGAKVKVPVDVAELLRNADII
jgi:hypothetical protein